jgi:hypothetical protein
MMHRASWPLKCAYSITILSTVLPIGISSSGWVAATLGGGGASPLAGVTILGPLLFFILGLYRIWTVVRLSRTLDSFETTGVSKILRGIGVVCLYLGALIAIANWIARPAMRMLIASPTESGVEFYVVGVYLALLRGIGVLGLISFELSRLLCFEAESRRLVGLCRGPLNADVRPQVEPRECQKFCV